MIRGTRQYCALRRRWSRRAVYVAALCLASTGGPLWASKLIMKDGRVYEGRLVRLSSIGEQAAAVHDANAPQVQSIELVDDNLRRIFVPKAQVREAPPEADITPVETFNISQQVSKRGGEVRALGAPIRITPFDEFGRRTFTMNTGQGKIDVVQCITKITPHWTKVEAQHLMTGRNFVWDMRIATSSIPPDTLRKIVTRHVNPKRIEDRLKLVKLFLQGERYADARQELQAVMQDFPDSKQRFESALRDLNQTSARRTLAEVEVRTKAGQHRLSTNVLQNFPTEGVAGETLQAVRQALDEYRGEFDRHNEVLQQINELVGKLDTSERTKVEPACDEIKRELNLNTLGRMASFRQFWADASLSDQEKLSLAISGWLVGTDDALRKLPVAVSLFDCRNLVRQYLAESAKIKRKQILADLAAQEAATPELISKLLRYMLPPVETTASDGGPAGFFELSVNGLTGQPPITYYVQLPPEYDPHRPYPAVVTLNGSGTTPQQQIDWWAGAAGENGERLGQATRYGYIVIAPAWTTEGQIEYGFSAAEHAAVLNSLRDACRRFSIDTDRVFLSGHSMGGDAAWDLALAHPDLWAGVIPVVARSDMYIGLLWENMRRLPFYLVSGELDGGKAKLNAKDLDRYLTNTRDGGFNATVVEFQGRGHEHFSDEILRLFDWMNRFERDFFPKDFTVKSLRPWDNYFWWVELDEFPEKAMIDPEEWSTKKARNPAQTKAQANAANGLVVTTAAKRSIIWLSPELIDFKHKLSISVNGRLARLPGSGVEPSLAVMLEDARTRADRKHPFWAKLEMPSSRVNDGEGDSETK
ncbi:MAG TPA: alpha/beta hydrolase-fold protein [Pirellulales bacterium]|nr:alpha/beta hydrolase-fold protein [Pirellulales bacterium]